MVLVVPTQTKHYTLMFFMFCRISSKCTPRVCYPLQMVGPSSSGGIQPLESPGSCLQHFRALPFIECNNHDGNCFHWQDGRSYWLTSIPQRDQFIKPVGMAFKSETAVLQHVSRCSVCRRSMESLLR